MTFDEFKLRSQTGIQAKIDSVSALGLIDYLPDRFQHTQLFWVWVCISTIAVALALTMFISLWIVALFMVLITHLLFQVIIKVASRCALDHAEENEEFFNMLVDKKLLILTNKSDG
jgi:hypothetical protein